MKQKNTSKNYFEKSRSEREWIYKLENARPLNSEVTISSEAIDYVTEDLLSKLDISTYKISQKKEILAGILVNLFFCNILKPSLLRYSRDNHTKYRNSLWKPRTVNNIMNAMEKEGFIESKEGFYINHLNYGRQTRIWPAEKLDTVFQKIPFDSIVTKHPYLIVRDHNKKTVEPPDNDYTEYLKEFMNNYHEMLSEHRITVVINNSHYPVIPDSTMIFNNNSLFQGGRIYTHLGQQQLDKNKRKQIKIDDRDTCELDYSALHIHMIYAIEGLSNPEKPYVFSKTDDEPMRNIMKMVSLRCINSVDRRKALQSIANDIYYQAYMENKKDIDGKYRNNKEILERRGIKGANDLVLLFENHHAPVNKYFYSNCGTYLQNIDSCITRNILQCFNNRNIPCLPIHDSYIITDNHAHELESVMSETYKSIMKGSECPVENPEKILKS